MPASPAADPVRKRFRAALDELYGDRIERVVLFGLRARGDARGDSGYDVAVFVKALLTGGRRWTASFQSSPKFSMKMERLSTLCPTGRALIMIAIPLMREIRREGIDL